MTDGHGQTSSDAVTIRAAREIDAEPLRALLAQLGYERTATGIAADLASDRPRSGVLVAEREGRVVGLLALEVRRPFQRDELITVIDALVVDESVRSVGVGAALLDAAVQRAACEGCGRVELHSNRRRRRARRFYERHGFTVTSNHFVRRLR